MKKSCYSLFRRLICAALAAAASASFAVDYTWQGGSSGDWNVSANWLPSTGTPSTASDTATFNAAATVALPDTVTVRTVINNAPVTLTIAANETLNFSNGGG
ncbi:MAG: hypothetical protein FWF12_11495, partial [Betaproteobacteria bacterium]|nr:hypothetical protein [Betaproteobacteria bacterium]